MIIQIKLMNEILCVSPNILIQMHLLLYAKKNCFSVISSNIQSIKAICLQKNCVSKNEDFSHIQLEGYNSVTQEKTSSKRED